MERQCYSSVAEPIVVSSATSYDDDAARGRHDSIPPYTKVAKSTEREEAMREILYIDRQAKRHMSRV